VLREVRVNDLPIDFKQLHRFSSKERKFEFVIYSPTLRNQENIKYHYKLLGYNENWLVQGAQFNTITYNALSPGKYTLVVKAELSGKFSSEAQFVFTIMSPFYMQWWFILGSILLFLTAVYLIYRRQLNRQRQKSKQINELNLSKLTAIQSQMNPHFIFNSLNSIQDLVLQQNATKAYDSINKFAALIRKIMHHSSSEFIDIEEELSILNIYLELELLRFKKDFSYQINSNNITDIEIPPMLIQPYVENALKHGLLHKAGEKNLQIDMILQNGVFTCIITDNGIGRKKSQEMKDRQNKLYDSFSGSSLNTRLSILKKHFGGEIGVEIIDLYDEANNAIGTRVELRAPFKQKY
jgi:LytS/YehU family sensor histidine kinase